MQATAVPGLTVALLENGKRCSLAMGNHIAFNAFAAIVPERGTGIVILTNDSKGQQTNREWVNAWLETDYPAFDLSRIEL